MNRNFRTCADPERRVGSWILQQTHDATSVMDLGCGLANYLKCCPTNKRLGIDIFEPYIDFCRETYGSWGMKFILGDVRKYRELVEEKYECALLMDVIEHLTKEDGVKLILELQDDVDKILLFTPLGYVENDMHDDNRSQLHLSGWYPSDLEDLGFKTFVDEHFHYDKPQGHQAAIYAVWMRF